MATLCHQRLRSWYLASWVLFFVVGLSWHAEAAGSGLTGAEIYQAQCAKCHGPKGEGVADKYDEPLYGDRSVKALARLISKTMPEDSKEKCTGEDADKVAAYIHQAFYSPEARGRLNPARVQLARLTVRQYINSVADLGNSFRPAPDVSSKRGLSAEYYDARNFRRDKRAISRVDPEIDFQFGEGSPDPKIGTNEFAIAWEGSLLAGETGDYEFSVQTENGVRLWVNDQRKTLIDGWVTAGPEVRELRQTIRLIGGRAYPIKLQYFKFKDRSASIVLRWRPPRKIWETLPERHLCPEQVPSTLVVTTAFPPDDSSVGYERGTSVSKAWDQAATHAAIEIAEMVAEQIDSLAGCRADHPYRAQMLEEFCAEFASRAFRRPLSGEQRRHFVEAHFASGLEPDLALKRVVLLVLKSPRFLYPELSGVKPDDYVVASRLALGLWDSLPDDALLQAAAAGKLRTRDQIGAQASRMLTDSRTKAKLADFFHHWLEMDEGEDISKDTQTFPDFNEGVMADLRTSLDMFLEEVIWNGTSDYRQLLLADYMFLNQDLAKFYGVEPPGQRGFVKVSFDPQQRAGILTHPYLLSAFAYHKSSSPIHRGVFLTRNIVGRSLKPPPMAIEFMDGRFDPKLTMREKVAELTRPGACQTCHSVINPLGFSLENYDAVGRFRTIDNQKPVDATSDYTTASGQTIRLTGARDLAEYAAKNEEAHRGFIQQLFHHTVKQPAAAFGPGTLETLRESFTASGCSVRQLLADIVKISAARGVVEVSEAKSSPPET